MHHLRVASARPLRAPRSHRRTVWRLHASDTLTALWTHSRSTEGVSRTPSPPLTKSATQERVAHSESGGAQQFSSCPQSGPLGQIESGCQRLTTGAHASSEANRERYRRIVNPLQKREARHCETAGAMSRLTHLNERPSPLSCILLARVPPVCARVDRQDDENNRWTRLKRPLAEQSGFHCAKWL